MVSILIKLIIMLIIVWVSRGSGIFFVKKFFVMFFNLYVKRVFVILIVLNLVECFKIGLIKV